MNESTAIEVAEPTAEAPYYSKAALARKWGVHPNTIQRLVAGREIRFVRVRGQLRFRPQDVCEYEARFGVAPIWDEDAA
jgi:excisionase family DNA binding protein